VRPLTECGECMHWAKVLKTNPGNIGTQKSSGRKKPAWGEKRDDQVVKGNGEPSPWDNRPNSPRAGLEGAMSRAFVSGKDWVRGKTGAGTRA